MTTYYVGVNKKDALTIFPFPPPSDSVMVTDSSPHEIEKKPGDRIIVTPAARLQWNWKENEMGLMIHLVGLHEEDLPRVPQQFVHFPRSQAGTALSRRPNYLRGLLLGENTYLVASDRLTEVNDYYVQLQAIAFVSPEARGRVLRENGEPLFPPPKVVERIATQPPKEVNRRAELRKLNRAHRLQGLELAEAKREIARLYRLDESRSRGMREGRKALKDKPRKAFDEAYYGEVGKS